MEQTLGQDSTPTSGRISTAIPINSYRTANGDAGASGRKSRGCAQSQSQCGIAEEDGFSDDHDQGTQYSSRERKIKMRAKRTQRGQDINCASPDVDTDSIIEDSKEATPEVTKRPDLRSAAILMNKGIRTNARKRTGAVPRVEIGGIVSILGCKSSLTGKIYVYDGLYKVRESWVDKGKAGCNVFKFKLVRVPGQPEAFSLWKSIQQWKDGITTRAGIILPDLTSGAESLPVSLVNDVDDEKGPAYFTYSPILKFAKPVSSVEPSAGCTCHNGCHPSNINCPCIQKNGGYLPYTSNGVLVNQKPLVLECGPSCQCPPSCWNRVSQDYICEFAGEAVDVSRAKELGDENNNCCIFYSTHTYQSVGVLPGESNEASKIPFPLIISAKDIGNIARFMNHSCSPNVLWQAVLRANNRECDIHIMFFAIKNIPPMTELTYDYGMVPPDKVRQGKKRCLCGSPKCRGYFY
ncbi:hypothetical protein SLA2020_523860 [Shorea laevis]